MDDPLLLRPGGGTRHAHLTVAMRLHVNYFQPSFRLVETTPTDPPWGSVTARQTHPVTRVIRRQGGQRRSKGVAEPNSGPPSVESLERFLARLPDRWLRDGRQHFALFLAVDDVTSYVVSARFCDQEDSHNASAVPCLLTQAIIHAGAIPRHEFHLRQGYRLHP